MPRRKSNLNKQVSREAKRQRRYRGTINGEEGHGRQCPGDNNVRTDLENNIETRIYENQQRQRTQGLSFLRLAFEYEPTVNYSSHPKITIKTMDKECTYCHALKFPNETPGLCCASGKVLLPPLATSPEPLFSLISGVSNESKLVLQKIRKFNACFQMTSFGATKIHDFRSNGRNFESTFKIQGQVYHKIGSLMPMPNQQPKFLQIYFMGSDEERVSTRCRHNLIERLEERLIVELLEHFLEEHN